MCAGSVFPPGTTTAVIMAKVMIERKGPGIPANVPEHLAAVIRQCLQADPLKRPTASQVQQVGTAHDNDCMNEGGRAHAGEIVRC